jgi:hypothetical protein
MRPTPAELDLKKRKKQKRTRSDLMIRITPRLTAQRREKIGSRGNRKRRKEEPIWHARRRIRPSGVQDHNVDEDEIKTQ